MESQVCSPEKLRSIDEVLELPLGSLSGDERLSELPGWDSVAVISFLAMADERFQATIQIDRIRDCKIVADLIALLSIS